MPRLSGPNFPLDISDHLQLARSTIHQTPPTEWDPTLHYHLLHSAPPLGVRDQPILTAISRDRHQSNNAHPHSASQRPSPSDSLFLLVQRVTRDLNHWLSVRVRQWINFQVRHTGFFQMNAQKAGKYPNSDWLVFENGQIQSVCGSFPSYENHAPLFLTSKPCVKEAP